MAASSSRGNQGNTPPAAASITIMPMPNSPFFRPNPRLSKDSHGRQSIAVKSRFNEQPSDADVVPLDELEKKSSLVGAYANLCTVIIGAGIVGLPYAIKEAGLVSGTIMIVACAVLTDYSLRAVISAGKLVNVNSYETLMEATFGRAGFLFVSINMFFLSYGSMVAYLQIIRDTLPVLFGVDQDDIQTKSVVMFIVTLMVLVPLSSQRDMANLEKTSSLNVVLNTCLVALVVGFAPVNKSVEARGGILQMISEEPFFDLSTFFVGFGVCSFAFVCQDGSFIIAGSMKTPSKQRWKRVTNGALLTCGVLELTLGVVGYLAYQSETTGNVLNNMDASHWSGLVSRAILSTTMLFAYPINLYVVRHVFVVLFFKGTMAHEGGDSIMLARRDRRLILTLSLYILSLIPALLMTSTGKVLAVTGAIAGSSLAYIVPGMAIIAVHSSVFIELVHKRWSASNSLWGYPERVCEMEVGDNGNTLQHLDIGEDGKQQFDHTTTTPMLDVILWYLFLMPIWCVIASVGKMNLADHVRKEDMASPSVVKPKRISLVVPQRYSTTELSNRVASAMGKPTEQTALIRRSSSITPFEVEDELKNEVPAWMDFIIAVGYIVLGVVAMVFGLISILFM